MCNTNNNSIFLLAIRVLAILIISQSAYSQEPIAFIGHGSMFDSDGNEIGITEAFIEQSQEYYLGELYQAADDDKKALFDRQKAKLLQGSQWDKQSQMIANAALIDWLIREVNPENAHILQGKNNLLQHYLRKQLTGPDTGKVFIVPDRLQGLIEQSASKSSIEPEARGFSTMLSGQDYIDECAASGVPIPPGWGDSRWQSRGSLTDAQEFIGNPPMRETEARVFTYETQAPEGACIALPRVNNNGQGNTIELLGIICMGKATSKACFWDNQQNDLSFDIPLGTSVPLSNFAGGADLLGGQGGVCTNCHAGENAFVIHPGTPLDLSIMPDDWYDPLVHPSWPQNAGPTNILGSSTGPGQCTSCHSKTGGAGRFPKISTKLNAPPRPNVPPVNQYCAAILNNAVTRTMPTGNPGDPAYSAHVTSLQSLCNATPTPVLRVNTVIDYKDVELGFAFKKALAIHNDGDAALTVSVSTITPSTNPNRTHWSQLNNSGAIIINPGDDPLILPQIFEPKAPGTHTIQMRVTSNDPTTATQDITLTGKGTTPIPLDTVLVLDRSGSMRDPAGDRIKVQAMRDAAMLYTDLLRENVGGTGSGDKLGLVKYNGQNSTYLNFDLITEARKNNIEANELSGPALVDLTKLKPDGRTGIGGAMQRAASTLGGPLTNRKQVMVVLTDGKENESPFINNVIGGIQSDNNRLQMYSVGLGFNIEPTKLQNITNMGTEGYHQVSSSLSGENLFDLETFYFKIFSNATGMDLVVDPTHVVNLLTPDPIIIDSATIISSDRSANFLVLDDPVLRTFYDLEFITPSGAVITPGTTIGGTAIQEMSRHTYKIYRVVFPDVSQANTYVGDWQLRLTPNGSWNKGAIKEALAGSEVQYSAYITPHTGLVPVGFAAAVASNYKLQVQVLPSHYLPGAQITLTGSLSDRGWPATEGQVHVTVTAPDGTNSTITLLDDGNNADANNADGTWTNRFIQTGLPGVYKFYFQSTGYNERGELAPREATRYVTLMQAEPTPDDRDSLCIPCVLLRFLLLLAFLLLLWIWYCTCLRRG